MNNYRKLLASLLFTLPAINDVGSWFIVIYEDF